MGADEERTANHLIWGRVGLVDIIFNMRHSFKLLIISNLRGHIAKFFHPTVIQVLWDKMARNGQKKGSDSQINGLL